MIFSRYEAEAIFNLEHFDDFFFKFILETKHLSLDSWNIQIFFQIGLTLLQSYHYNFDFDVLTDTLISL